MEHLTFTLVNTAASTQGLIASRKVEQRSLSLPETTTCIFYSLNANDNNNAYNALVDFCTDGVSKPRGAFAVSGDVVVYWCNYSNLPSCNAADASFSIQQFQSMVCGSFIAGFIQWSGQAYGQEDLSKDPDFCGNGLAPTEPIPTQTHKARAEPTGRLRLL